MEKQWFCSVGGQQYGPVSEEELRSWVASGRVRPADLVWSEGMAEWTAASMIPGLTPTTAVTTTPTQYAYVKRHRGGGILALGIVGIVLCCFFYCSPIGLILGVIACVMGSRDLPLIRTGRMDPSGAGTTQAGRICGIVAICLGALFSLVLVIMVVVFIGAVSAGF